MSVETESESLFKEHCDSRSVLCRRIEEGITKVADFEVALCTGTLIAEIKQLEPNERDRVLNAMGGTAVGSVLVKRMRNLLSDAYKQIKPYANRGLPCIVVCYNNAGFMNQIGNFIVTSAMFGGMAIRMALDQDQTIHHDGQGFTGDRKVTRNTCRGLSAVCVLSKNQQETELVAYHNPYASIPISPSSLSSLANAQFGYDDPHGSWHGQLFARALPVVVRQEE